MRKSAIARAVLLVAGMTTAIAVEAVAATSEEVVKLHPMVAVFHGKIADVGDTLKLQEWYRGHDGFACKEVHINGAYGISCAARKQPEANHALYFGQLTPKGTFIVQVGKTVEDNAERDLTGDRLATSVAVSTGLQAPIPLKDQ